MEYVFEIERLRKSYTVNGNIPNKPFKECKLTGQDRPSPGENWRKSCGQPECIKRECPKRPTLTIDSMNIPRGKIVSILGYSGSGKTTLLNMLAMMDNPDSDSGKLNYNYKDEKSGEPCSFNILNSKVNKLKPNDIRKHYYGFVFQNGYLISHLNAKQNVTLSIDIDGMTTGKNKIDETLEHIKLSKDTLKLLPKSLSGGEYHRVATIRALANDPQIIFADEPTGNLDPHTGSRVMDRLIKWQKDIADLRTIILVTHNLDYAIEYSDYIFVLSGGKIVGNNLDVKNSDIKKLKKEIEDMMKGAYVKQAV